MKKSKEIKQVEYNGWTGRLTVEMINALSRSIGQYNGNYRTLKIGITGRNPQERFNEHLKDRRWTRMVVLYKTSSEDYIRNIEKELVDRHWSGIINEIGGGGGKITQEGDFFLYVLLNIRVAKKMTKKK